VLDLCGVGEDGNASGDLDVTTSLSFTLEGNGATVRQTCDGEAVLRKNAGASQLVVDDTRITGGESNGLSSNTDIVVRNGSIVDGNIAPNAGGGILSTTDVRIEDSTVRDNVAGTSGGGAWASDTMTVTNSTITRNRSGTSGGGIGAFDPITVTRSTISDNTADTGGGGINAFDDLVVQTSTIARNRSATQGGGIDNIGADDPTTVESSTIVGNAAPIGANIHTAFNTTVSRSIVSMGSGGEDCTLDGGGNLPVIVGGDASCYGLLHPLDEESLHPMVAAPAANGGPTPTQRTVAPSRAIDRYAGPCPGGTDQRGNVRPAGPSCDAGAYEGVAAPCTVTFDDVSTTHPFFGEICWLTQLGITGGFADGGYHPSDAVSRQAMAAFLYRLALAPPVDAEQAVATDVPLGHPFLREITWLVDEGIATGFGDETYRPLAPVTRQAMAAFLFRVAGEPAPATPPSQTFSDVTASHPFFDEIAWMTEAGVANGFEDGTFRPSAAVSRQAMAAFLLRLADDVPLLGL